jgi:hypothetical protein
MRAIEQLIHHFWARGALTREEARFLVGHGFARESDLPGFADPPADADLEPDGFPTPDPDPGNESNHVAHEDADVKAREAEELEDELVGRNAGSRKGGGKKKKPTGHNLGPAVCAIAAHLALREPYPALFELGARLRPCTDWRDAARAVSGARPEALETALVGLLTTRPRALGELWFWCDLEPLYEWADDEGNVGPVAEGLAKLLRADNLAQVGRLGQLLKATEVQALLDLLPARRAFLNLLPVLYHAHFPKLGQWLVPPTGEAAKCWPALPWSFVFVYNARHGATGQPPLGYPLERKTLPARLEDLALTTAVAMAPVAVREWLITGQREHDHPTAALRVYCPFTWRV